MKKNGMNTACQCESLGELEQIKVDAFRVYRRKLAFYLDTQDRNLSAPGADADNRGTHPGPGAG